VTFIPSSFIENRWTTQTQEELADPVSREWPSFTGKTQLGGGGFTAWWICNACDQSKMLHQLPIMIKRITGSPMFVWVTLLHLGNQGLTSGWVCVKRQQQWPSSNKSLVWMTAAAVVVVAGCLAGVRADCLRWDTAPWSCWVHCRWTAPCSWPHRQAFTRHTDVCISTFTLTPIFRQLSQRFS